jgi:hypothetical protein
MTGEDVETLVRRIHETPQQVVEIGKEMLAGK